MRSMLRSKIHRATVTETRVDYEGSITIDIDLLERAGLWIGEKVLIADVNNGNRLETYVLPVTEDMRLKCSEVAAMLRAAGIPTDLDLMGRKMQKAMKYAAGIGAKYAVIVGAKEMESGCVTVKDMASGEQQVVPVTDLISKISC